MKGKPAYQDDIYEPVRAFLRDMGTLIATGRNKETVLAVKERLASLLGRSPEIPNRAKQILPDQYARHLLYRDPDGRFEVVVMAWGPGQQTPVHDHSGIWCVEGVISGKIDVTRYDISGEAGGSVVRMDTTDVIHAGRGECGALIPPVEYHRISNPYAQPAYTLHVYGGRMQTCRVFVERADGHWDVSTRALSFTSPEAVFS